MWIKNQFNVFLRPAKAFYIRSGDSLNESSGAVRNAAANAIFDRCGRNRTMFNSQIRLYHRQTGNAPEMGLRPSCPHLCKSKSREKHGIPLRAPEGAQLV